MSHGVRRKRDEIKKNHLFLKQVAGSWYCNLKNSLKARQNNYFWPDAYSLPLLSLNAALLQLACDDLAYKDAIELP